MAITEQQINDVIDYANEQVKTIVAQTDIENDKQVQRMYLAIDQLYKELNTMASRQIPSTLFNSYIQGLATAEQLLQQLGIGAVLDAKGLVKIAQAPMHVEAIANIVSDTLDDLASAFRTAEQYSFKHLDQAIADVKTELANGYITGMTTKQITQRVGKKFGEKGMTAFVTKDGKHLPLDFYAKVVTRTKIQTAENHGHLNRYYERDVKYVYVTGNMPTCGYCARYRGIVFATSRKDPDFPYINLHQTFPVHPNCRCTFRPWIRKFKSDSEVEREKQNAKQFDINQFDDPRDHEERRKYKANQKAKQKARKKRLTFNRMQRVLGKDGPQSYNEFANASKLQYHSWVAQMKNMYNPHKQYEPPTPDDSNADKWYNNDTENESDTNQMDKSKEKRLQDYALNDWQPSLSKPEAIAITEYTKDENYLMINRYLRGVTDKISDKQKQMISLVESGLNKFDFNERLTAYRGVDKDEYEFISSHNELIDFVDFKSSSLDNDIAQLFSEMQNDDTHYVVKFDITPNASGAYIKDISTISNEHEFLLNKGQKYRIIEEKPDEKDDIKMITIEVLGHE